MLCLSSPASAQSRPLTTNDPATVPAGHIRLELGVDILRSVEYPASGLSGNLMRIGTLGLDFGVSSIAEIQFTGGVRNQLSITSRDPAAPLAQMLEADGSSTGDVEDLSIGAKVRLLDERASRPSFGIRFATRLPNAGNESGLGLDTTDFVFDVLLGKTVSAVRVAASVGFGILGDPVRGDRQNDVLTYGLSASGTVARSVELVGEVNGRLTTRSGTPPTGTDSRSLARAGARATRGRIQYDAALVVGLTDRDPSWGFTAGLTWLFKAFEVK